MNPVIDPFPATDPSQKGHRTMLIALILIGFAVWQWWRAQRLTALRSMQQGLTYCEQGEVAYGLLYLARGLEEITSRASSRIARISAFDMRPALSLKHLRPPLLDRGKDVRHDFRSRLRT